MKIAVVKYNAGNIYSVDYALKRLGVEATITSDKELLMSADKVIFPGVGEAETTMSHLRKNRLDEVIKNLKQPVLGICLGMQLMRLAFREELPLPLQRNWRSAMSLSTSGWWLFCLTAWNDICLPAIFRKSGR